MKELGDPLDPALVGAGEKDEMDRFARMNVYQYVSRDQAIEDREGKFIKVKWVRINKGTSQNPRVRCRLVGQELGFGVKDDELYAGTPSLVMLKLLLSWYASNWTRDSVLKVIDVKSAFLYGKARRRIYIELPTRDPQSGGDVVGMLDKSMYGTRDAPIIWQATVDKMLITLGFRCSVLQPGVYIHDCRQLRVMVHVDDFLVVGKNA